MPDERSLERDARVRELREHAMKQLDTINDLTAEIGRLREHARSLKHHARVMAEALDDIASGEFGINVSIKTARKALSAWRAFEKENT